MNKNTPSGLKEDVQNTVKYIQIKLITLKGKPRNCKGIILYGKDLSMSRVEEIIKARIGGIAKY